MKRLNWLLSAVMALSCPGVNALGLVVGQPIVPVTPVRVVPNATPGEDMRDFVPIQPKTQQNISPIRGSQTAPPTRGTVVPDQDRKGPQAQAQPKTVKSKTATAAKPGVTQRATQKPATSTIAKSAAPASNSVQEPTVTGNAPTAGQTMFGIRLQSEQVNVDVTDHVAKTHISEVFRNDSEEMVSGTYLFPLPKDAAFNSFSLYIDGKPVEGKILESKEARREYETIVRLMVDPGLLEYADYKTVKARLFPIPPHGTRKIELEYTQVLKTDNGLVRYEFPLRSEDKTATIDDIDLRVHLASKQAIGSVWSPSYRVDSKKSDPKHVEISYQAHHAIPSQNFVLMYNTSDKGLAADLVTQKNANEDGYFLLSLAPPVGASAAVSKDILLVADTSGSMTGNKIRQLKSALKYIVKALPNGDRFNVITFNTTVSTFKPALVAASADNRAAALAYIDSIRAVGGTNISMSLETAAAMFSADASRPAYMIFATDGMPTSGEKNISKLVASFPNLDNVRIFDLGIGNDVNPRLLDRLAERHHGISQYIEPDANLEQTLLKVYQQIQKPILTDVKVVFDGVQTKDVYPAGTLDVFSGEQAVLLGRYSGSGKANVVVTGKINGQVKSYSFPMQFANEDNNNADISRLWAMRRVAFLDDAIEDTQDKAPQIAEIVELSKKYGILSPYASMLVKDPNNFRIGESRSAIDLDSSSLENRLEAIRKSKMLTAYKSSSQIGDSTYGSADTKLIGDKTFRLTGDTWIDSTYEAARWKQPETVTFGSKEYFDLVANDFKLARYFAIGKQVIVVLDGHCYKVVAPTQIAPTSSTI